jgi:hypothetical protein
MYEILLELPPGEELHYVCIDTADAFTNRRNLCPDIPSGMFSRRKEWPSSESP